MNEADFGASLLWGLSRNPSEAQLAQVRHFGEKVRQAGDGIVFPHSEAYAFHGGSENAWSVVGLEAGCIVVSSSVALSQSSPLFKYMDRDRLKARCLDLKMTNERLEPRQSFAVHGIHAEKEQQQLKFTIAVVPKFVGIDLPSASEVRTAIYAGEWTNLMIAFCSLRTSNYNAFGNTVSGDVLLGFVPQESFEVDAQRELQDLATQIYNSGAKPCPLYEEVSHICGIKAYEVARPQPLARPMLAHCQASS